MPDENTVEVTPDEKPVEIKIVLPEAWTIGQYTTFIRAQRKYETEHPDASPFQVRYIGACALIKAGYVRLDGLPQLQQAIASDIDETLPLRVMATIVRHVAIPLEAALSEDFLA
jgi:hypothetical protein